MQGTLYPGFFPRFLGELYLAGKSGVLRLTRDEQSLAIRLRDGRIAVEATPKPERRERASPLAGSLERRLGSVLRDLGIEKDRPRAPAPVFADREGVLEALSWQEGAYAFEEQTAVPAGAEAAANHLSMLEVVREAVQRIEDPDVVRFALGDGERRLALGPVERRSMHLNPSEDLVLSQADGARTIREVIGAAGPHSEEAQRSLFGLLCMGAVERLPPAANQEPVTPEADPPPAGDAAAFLHDGATEARRREIQEALLDLLHSSHFEVLGIPKDADQRQVKQAYVRQAKRFHPDRHADPALADLRKQLEALLIRIGEAYEVLSHPGRRARYESELAARESQVASGGGASPHAPQDQTPEAAEAVENALMADDAIRRADQLMLEAQYWDAIQILEAVIPRTQSKTLKHEAQVRLARAYTKNPKWVRRGEDLLQAVVREDPSWVDAYFVLGTIYRGNGLRSRAITMFRKVLELKPNHRPAAAEIRSLEAAPPYRKLIGRI